MKKESKLLLTISMCVVLTACGNNQSAGIANSTELTSQVPDKESAAASDLDSANGSESKACQSLNPTAPKSMDEDYSMIFDRVRSMVYGDDFHMSYSMEEIIGTTDEDNFLCEYSKMDLILNSNCVLLFQEAGDGNERTIKYDIDVSSGECALIYDNDSGESIEIWSGTGAANGNLM